MTNKTINRYLLTALFCFLSAPAIANQVEVVNVKANQASDKIWRFSVTLKHADEGWDHYANEWQVIAPDNKILGTRTLYHPHVNEQPFTRSLDGIKIPEKIKTVRVIAKDTVHGLSRKAAELNLATKEVRQITLELKKKSQPDKTKTENTKKP